MRVAPFLHQRVHCPPEVLHCLCRGRSRRVLAAAACLSCGVLVVEVVAPRRRRTSLGHLAACEATVEWWTVFVCDSIVKEKWLDGHCDGGLGSLSAR